MLFIDDLSSLNEEHIHLFNPRQYTKDSVQGLCVYAYLRDVDDEFGPATSIYYIGEGTAARPTGWHSNEVRVPKHKDIWILSDGHEHKGEVRFREAILIHYFGRVVNGTGILLNTKSYPRRLLPWVPPVTPTKKSKAKELRVLSDPKIEPTTFESKNIPEQHFKKYVYDVVDCYDW